MRYAFMSFSLPEAGLTDLVDAARRYGYEGLEPRIDAGHGHGVELATTAGQRREIRAVVASAGVEIACVATGCRFADPAQAAGQADTARRAVELAADVGARRVRVFGGQLPDGISREVAHDSIVRSLRELGPFAADHQVTLALETHDAWTRPAHVAAIMTAVEHPAVGVNWDVMHPPRTGGATLESSHAALRPWIRHVHVHDAGSRVDALDFRPMGEGDFDHRLILSLLLADGYDGYLSGEWIGWEEGQVHLPREIARLRRYESELDRPD